MPYRSGLVTFTIERRKEPLASCSARLLGSPRRGHAGAILVDHDSDERPVELPAVRIRRRDHRHLQRIENDTGAYRVDPDQVDQRLDQDPIVAAAGVLPHLPQHLVGLNRYRLIATSGRGRVVPVRHRHDAGVDPLLPGPQCFRVPGQIGLHVVLVRDHDLPVGNLTVGSHVEQRQHPEPGMGLHQAAIHRR